jgi:hypothetical protein
VQPSFDAVAMVLEMDRHMLFLQDERGHVPLYYVKEDQWGKWIDFIESRKDELWPKRSSFTAREERDPQLATLRPNSQIMKDPANSLPTYIATMVAAGTIQPDGIECLMNNATQQNLSVAEYDHPNDSCDSDSDNDSENDSDSYDSDDDDSDSSFDRLLSTLPIHPRVDPVDVNIH